ncbi:MAG: hypothetical protein [Bacteriophage sp.]|nr:MAG: hypothetical protein [Bacteriophage sp.]
MNPIYRFGFVNTFFVDGFAVGTDGTHTSPNYSYTKEYIPVSNIYPRKLFMSSAPENAGVWYDSNKNIISNFGSNPPAANVEFDIPNNAYYVRVNFSLSSRRAGSAWLRLGTMDADNYIAPYIVHPNYKDDLAKEYELETNQRFYRAKLSGKLSFIRDDYDYINNKPFDTTFLLLIEKSNDGGKTWTSYYSGQFMKTDCTFIDYDKKVTVQPDTIDEYNDVLAGLEKEYNLITLAPAIQRITINKRPLIQIYVPGDSIVSCFLGGTNWEQDANATTDQNALVRTYHFALCNILKEIQITSHGSPAVISGLYTGRMATGTTPGVFTGNLYPELNVNYYIFIFQQTIDGTPFGIALVEIRRRSDDVAMFRYQKATTAPFDILEFDLTAVEGSGATGTMHADMKSYNIYARYLCDVETIGDLNTYSLPTDDIVDNNRNYRRAIGYAIDVAFISNNFSDTPTEWGLVDNGKYFAPPYSIYGQTFYPIARSTWRYASLWFGFYLMDWILEEQARKAYTLRDAFPVASCISVLLNQIAPGIKHEATAEYSQFLYGSSNPISGLTFRLLVSQKTNIINGEYQQPAQKAPTTLQQFTNMLRDCFKCYWYIDGGKFKIEHIQFFKNGGSYGGGAIISRDLTKEINLRNGLPWAFNTSEYSFDKVDLAERYQFEWMDDVTTPFEGLPIQVISKYVTPGKIEEINISNFTSDIDMMLLNPGNMSSDGFALFAAVPPTSGSQWILPFTRQTINGVEYFLQNGYLAFINLQSPYWMYDLPARRVSVNGSEVYAYGIERKKKQTFSFPATDDPNPMQLIKTYIGNGQVDKLSVNLHSRSIKATLKYDTE